MPELFVCIRIVSSYLETESRHQKVIDKKYENCALHTFGQLPESAIKRMLKCNKLTKRKETKSNKLFLI